MKKYLLLLPLLTLAINTNAQTKFGAKAGVNISNLKGDSESANSKVGIYVGGYANLKISEQFAFQPEVLYSAQGAKESGNLEIDQLGRVWADVKYKLNYINVPLMIKYYPVKGFNIEAGPQIGFLVDSKMNIKGHVTSTQQKFDTNEKMNSLLKSVDFGLNVGLGYEFENGLNLGARYNFGLTNISNVEEGKIKNSVFSLGLGYSF